MATKSDEFLECVERKNVEAVKQMIANYESGTLDLNLQHENQNGDTAVEITIKQNHSELCEILLNKHVSYLN